VTGTTVTLPNAASRANQALTFDGSGNVTVGALANAVISSAMQPVASASSVDAARSVMGIVGRNKIINGNFNIWQRGTSITPALSTIAYTADRFYAFVTGATPNYARVTLGGSGVTGSDTALQITGTGGNTTNNLGQRIEAANCTDMIAGKIFTLSAMIYSFNTTFTPTYSIRTAGSGDNFSTNNPLASGSLGSVPLNAWTKVSTTFTCTNECLKGIQAEIQLGAILAGQTILVKDFQLESGSVATPFEHKLLALELVLCQRYFEQGFARGTNYSAGAGNYRAYSVPFAVTKRVGPSVGTNSVVYGGAGANSLVIEYVDSTMHSSRVTTTSVGSFIVDYNWNASAEL
jgi:hypothetical protein